MIIKKCIINYLKSLKYYLPGLGIILIFLSIGVANILKNASSNLNTLYSILENNVSDSSSININSFKNIFIDEFKNLPWNNIWQLISIVFSPSFLNNIVTKIVISFIGEDNYTNEISSDTENIVNNFSNSLTFCIIMFIIGILIAYFYIRMGTKKELKNKANLKRIILSIVINFILNITLISFMTYLLGVLPIGALLTLLFTLFVNEALSLFDAYLLKDDDSLTFKQVFTFKNISYLVLGSVIITLISTFIGSILFAITNQTIGFIFNIPLYFILISVISLNAYSYIKDYNLIPQVKK